MTNPPIPPELCGIRSCVFTPHQLGTPHSWATDIAQLVNDTRLRLQAIATRPRIYTTDINGLGIRRELDHATREQLEKAGRKVFETKGGSE